MTPFTRRTLLKSLGLGAVAAAAPTPSLACAPQRGTGDLAVIIERATGSVLIVDTTAHTILARVDGFGDLSHASLVFSRCARFAFVFGRDGGLTKLDILAGAITGRTIQAGNSIGGAISDDGRLIAVANYQPGGVRVFDAVSLEPVADVPAIWSGGQSKTVGLADLPGRRFIVSLWDAGESWLLDFFDGPTPKITKFPGIGQQPYDALTTADGRRYIVGLFGEDGLAAIDLFQDPPTVSRLLPGYRKSDPAMPVYKMPHLEGWALAGDRFGLPAIGRPEVLWVDSASLTEIARTPVHGQPIFVLAQPGRPRTWVNFAHPHNDTIQVIDSLTAKIVHTFTPGPAVLHMAFAPRGHEAWLSVRDAARVDVYCAHTFQKRAELPAQSPSGIFMTARAHRLGL